jgi:hypothetical protein
VQRHEAWRWRQAFRRSLLFPPQFLDSDEIEALKKVVKEQHDAAQKVLSGIKEPNLELHPIQHNAYLEFVWDNWRAARPLFPSTVCPPRPIPGWVGSSSRTRCCRDPAG